MASCFLQIQEGSKIISQNRVGLREGEKVQGAYERHERASE